MVNAGLTSTENSGTTYTVLVQLAQYWSNWYSSGIICTIILVQLVQFWNSLDNTGTAGTTAGTIGTIIVQLVKLVQVLGHLVLVQLAKRLNNSTTSVHFGTILVRVVQFS